MPNGLALHFKKILNWFIPMRCLGCGEMASEDHQLCAECWKSINFINTPYCKVCGYPHTVQTNSEELCDFCGYEEILYESARSALIYDEGAKKLILRLKYADHTSLVPIFARWLVNAGQDLFEDADYLVPVPLHWTRLLQRRYNQAALLVVGMKKIAPSLPKYAPQFLRRIKKTQSQGQKNKKERIENVQNAFYSSPRHKQALQDKTIILVDDVMASGTTINECIKTLVDAGCKNVRVLTLARSLLEHY
ncbi:MAG: ComF family protein [Alphaproteobacteria bacterium]|nr:ComF family protein [Alphaproteobacteria bacterium]